MFGLRINNFRSFVDQDFQFSKINILIGTNSSGKSSLLKFLMMMEGTIYYNDKSNVNLLLESWLYDLGTYYDIINHHDTSKNIEFSFSFGQGYEDWFIRYLMVDSDITEELIFETHGHHFGSFTKVRFRLTKNLQNSDDLTIIIENNKIGNLTLKVNPNHPNKKEKITTNTLFVRLSLEREGKIIDLNAKCTKIGFLIIPDTGTFVSTDSEDDLALFFDLFYLTSITEYINQLFFDLCYINPLDSQPERNYTKSDDTGNTYMQHLEDVIQFMVDESIDTSFKEKVLAKFDTILKDYGLAKEIKLIRANNMNAMELQVRLTDEDFWTNIKDVGLGVPLQIPMLMQAIIADAEGGKTLLFEQPEVHIHPKLQAKFMEALVTGGGNNTYFIETHSEHIIRMLQVLVKEKTIKSEDVTIHYFTRENDRSAVSLHRIMEDGFLDKELPEDFFDVSYHLASRLLQNS